MAQDYKQEISREIQNLVLNYPMRAIRSSTDWLILTIGFLQIEKLDWQWQPDTSRVRLNTVLEYDPYHYKSPAPWNKFKGEFKTTKYGLSVREKHLTVASYEPLFEQNTNLQEQSNIMWTEAERMKKSGARTCNNGIEIALESHCTIRLIR